MLPNYLWIYSSDLCQTKAFKKAFKNQNNHLFFILVPKGGGGFVHAYMGKAMLCYHCIIYIVNSSKKTLFSLSLTAICAELCFQTTGGHIPLLCTNLEPLRSHLRSKKMATVYPKSWFWMHAFDWPEQTLKI